jgi:RHS repeat-associated protein
MYVGSGDSIDVNTAAGLPNNELDAYGITSNDTVGGGYYDATGVEHLFTYSQAQGFADLGTGPTGSMLNPQELNDAGQFVGTLSLAGGVNHGFRFTPGVGYDDIGTLGGQNSFGFGITDEGTILGSAQTTDSPTSGFDSFGHAVIYNSQVQLVDLNAFVDPMSGLVLVTTFRSAGTWISGTATQNGINSAYRLNLETGMVDDIAVTNGGSLFGYGINRYGEVVGDGTVDGPGTPTAAFIFTDSLGIRKLNDLIDPASGWNLTNALGIDDNGDVIGTGYLNGRFAAFILRLPLRPPSGGAPTVAVAHTYGYDGLRTSTTNGPGTSGASVQFWFTQDYTQHDGAREHYVRIGNRIVAKVTYNPPGGGMSGTGMAMVAGTGLGTVGRWRKKPTDLGDLIAKVVLALMLAGGAGVTVAGFVGKKRRPAWVAATAGPVALFFVASCEMLGLDSRKSAATLWQRVETVYFHGGVGPGPVLTTNSDGSLREERRYEPFGQPIDADVRGSLGSVDFRREERNGLGMTTDPATGWSYHGLRWMQPQTARWISPDAVSVSNGLQKPWDLNPYQYSFQRPTQLWDPSGLDQEELGLAPDSGPGQEELPVATDGDSTQMLLGGSAPDPVNDFLKQEGINGIGPEGNRELLDFNPPNPAMDPSGMHISEAGMDFMFKRENSIPHLYNDRIVKPNASVGIGHLVHHGAKATEPPYPASELPWRNKDGSERILGNQEIRDLWRADLRTFEDTVKRHIHVPLTQNQFDALVDLSFNAGGAPLGDIIGNAVNGHASAGRIRDAFMGWTKNKESADRRAREAEMFISGDYTTPDPAHPRDCNCPAKL